MRIMQVAHDTTRINVSHYIHEMRFGPEYPGKINPLDGMAILLYHLPPDLAGTSRGSVGAKVNC